MVSVACVCKKSGSLVEQPCVRVRVLCVYVFVFQKSVSRCGGTKHRFFDFLIVPCSLETVPLARTD